MNRRFGWASLLLLCAWVPIAAGATLTPERTLRIEFSTSPPFIESLPNTLYAFLGLVDRIEPYTTITGSLYDDDVLLGVSTSSNGCCGTGVYSFHPVPVTWKASGSPWDFPAGDPAVVDFTSMHDGTIDGRIDIVIDAGRFDLDLEAVALRFIHATFSNGGSVIPPAPILRSVRILPELPGDPSPPQPPSSSPPSVDLDDDDLVVTTADLRNACEQSQGNTVVLNHSVTISNGSPSQEHIPSDCTLVLGPNVDLDVDRVTITFAGPLTIQSSHKADVKLDKSMFAAPSITFSLVGAGSAFMTVESTLHASHGSLLVDLGDDGKMEILRQRAGQENGLSAAEGIHIRGGQKFVGLVADTSVNAPLGFQLDMDGSEGVFKAVDEVMFSAAQGSIGITASGTKGLVEIKNADLLFGGAVSMHLAGGESTIKLNQVVMGSVSGATAGGVTIEAGSASASLGNVEASEVDISGVASVAMLASRLGSGGVLKIEKSFVSATGDVIMESSGVTEVKENDLTSATRIRVASGPGGACVAEPNDFAAPAVAACP
jgi:hypothetical protein